jgi:membrane fusion protein, multidrug efflux system
MVKCKVQVLILPVFVLSVISGCGNKKRNVENSTQPTPVKVMQIGVVQNNNTKDYVGTIQETVSIPLSFLVSGTAQQVTVSEGQDVHKGQLLANLNDFSYKSSYQISLAKEKQAKDAYARSSDVYKKGSLPEVKMVEVETGLEQARSSVELAKKNIDDCRLYAPASGVIGKRMIESGMNVVPGNPVFNLLKIDEVYAVISVPENEIAQISKGQNAVVAVSALNNANFEGKITEKGVVANSMAHTYDVKITLENKGEQLRPGMVCSVILSGMKAEEGLAIPLQTVQSESTGSKYVYIVDNNGKAVKRTIMLGKLSGNGDVLVTSGLEKGNLLIIEGFQKVSENTPIQIVK